MICQPPLSTEEESSDLLGLTFTKRWRDIFSSRTGFVLFLQSFVGKNKGLSHFWYFEFPENDLLKMGFETAFKILRQLY